VSARRAGKPAEKAARPLPVWELDPDWPKIPANFKVPFVSEVLIDAQDNAWLINAPAAAKDTDPRKSTARR
jgi:hypothetical protein